MVGLRVTDEDGGTAVATETITVKGADKVVTPEGTATPAPTPGHEVIVDPTPQPTVTPAQVAPTAPLTAKLVRQGKKVRVKKLSITPAVDVTVTVSCSGKGCGFKTKRIVVTGKTVNLKPMFKKALKKGAKITVSLSKDGLVGSSYTKVA